MKFEKDCLISYYKLVSKSVYFENNTTKMKGDL